MQEIYLKTPDYKCSSYSKFCYAFQRHGIENSNRSYSERFFQNTLSVIGKENILEDYFVSNSQHNVIRTISEFLKYLTDLWEILKKVTKISAVTELWTPINNHFDNFEASKTSEGLKVYIGKGAYAPNSTFPCVQIYMGFSDARLRKQSENAADFI